MARIIVIDSGKNTPHELKADRVRVGRKPECDLQFRSAAVSREHAELSRAGDDWTIADLASKGGTFVNGQRLTANEQVSLRDNDRIDIGPIKLLYQNELASKPLHPTPQVAIVDDLGSSISRVYASVDNSSGYGKLEVKPEFKLKSVLDFSRHLAGTVNIQDLVPRILDVLFQIFPQADRGCILLKEPDGTMNPVAQKLRKSGDNAPLRLSSTVVNRVLETGEGLLVDPGDEIIATAESIRHLGIRYMMCAPLLGRDGQPVGIINIDALDPGVQFINDDLDLLLAVARQAALSYENAQLVESYAEKQKYDNALKIAREIQRAFLPDELPVISGYEFYATYEAAQAVGGDYYDCFQLPGRIVLAFGDVSGKGIPSALLMSRLASCVENTVQFVAEVDSAMQAINNHICRKIIDGKFVTFLLLMIDLETHEMSLVNAGHTPPFIRRTDGQVEEFELGPSGFPIGVDPGCQYQVQNRKLAVGETVLLMTDGVDEGMNPQRECYTKERVRRFIEGNDNGPTELCEKLLADVRRHAAGRPQSDDIAIMAFGRLS